MLVFILKEEVYSNDGKPIYMMWVDEIMCKISAKIVNIMQAVFIIWNGIWWNYHCDRARLHDGRISKLDPEWRKKI